MPAPLPSAPTNHVVGPGCIMKTNSGERRSGGAGDGGLQLARANKPAMRQIRFRNRSPLRYADDMIIAGCPRRSSAGVRESRIRLARNAVIIDNQRSDLRFALTTAGRLALHRREPGQVRKEAATANLCKCRGNGSPPFDASRHVAVSATLPGAHIGSGLTPTVLRRAPGAPAASPVFSAIEASPIPRHSRFTMRTMFHP